MAKNIGIIKFTGKLGGLSGRNTAYGNIIQTPGGFKSERVKTEARYEPTRQLSSEFGKCATLMSIFKRSLDFYLKLLPDSNKAHNYIQQLLTAIKKCDVDSPKGAKTVGKGLLTPRGSALLLHFSFNRKRGGHFLMTVDAVLDLEQGKCTVKDFNPIGYSFPGSADTMGFQLVLLRIDFETADCVMTESALSFVSEKAGVAAFVLEAQIPKGKGTLLAILFVGFCSFDHAEIFWRKCDANVLEIVGMG